LATEPLRLGHQACQHSSRGSREGRRHAAEAAASHDDLALDRGIGGGGGGWRMLELRGPGARDVVEQEDDRESAEQRDGGV